MAISVLATPLQPQGPVRSAMYFPLMQFYDVKRTGLSKQSDLTTAADGMMYPNNFNDNTNLGAIQTYITAQATSTGLSSIFDEASDLVANNATLWKTFENYAVKYTAFRISNIAQYLKDYTLPTVTVTGTGIVKILALDATTFIAFTAGINAFVGTIAADGTITYGTQQTIISGGLWDACLIDTGKFVVVYQETTAINKAIVGTVSGTTITMGTAVNMFTVAQTGTCTAGTVVKLGTDKFMSVTLAASGQSLRYMACTVATRTITAGTEVIGASTGSNFQSIQNGADKFFVSYLVSSTVRVISGTVSGTTTTLGTEVNTALTNPGSSESECIALCATDKVLVVGGSSALICTIAVNVITAQTATTMGTAFVDCKYIYETVAGATYYFYNTTKIQKLTVSGNVVTDGGALNATYGSSVIKPYQQTSTMATLFLQTTRLEKVGIYFVLIRSSSAQLPYMVDSTTNGYSLYNGVTLITTVTPTVPFQIMPSSFISAITTYTKAYLGIKNTAGSDRVMHVQDVWCEVD